MVASSRKFASAIPWCRGCGRPSQESEIARGFCRSCGRDPRTGGTPASFDSRMIPERGMGWSAGALWLAAGVIGIAVSWLLAGLVAKEGAVRLGMALAASAAFGALAVKGIIRIACEWGRMR